MDGGTSEIDLKNDKLGNIASLMTYITMSTFKWSKYMTTFLNFFLKTNYEFVWWRY